MESKKFTLKDRNGNVKRYEVVAHDPDEGFALSCQVGGLLSGPLLAVFYELARTGNARMAYAVVVASLAAADEANPPTAEQMQQRALILEKIAPDRISSSIRAALNDVPVSLARRILCKTSREGRPLLDDESFNDAYARNYGELRAAIWEVIDFNGFFSLQDILPSSGQA